MKTPVIKIKVLIADRFHAAQEWLLELPAMGRGEAAEAVFEISNAPPEFLSEEYREILAKFPRDQVRSVSVGDILLIEDDENPDRMHVCTVEGVGFKFHQLQAA